MNQLISKVEDTKPYIKSIKSNYILKEIFSILGTKKYFDLIIYNKNLQNALKINIEDYKKISGRYKIGPKDGNVKEFILNTDILLFEGEYLNNKRWKGKEYYETGELEFEGEFLNGKRLKGKEYDEIGELEFEGEYLNGKRWNGKGKEYYYDDDDDEFIYEGQYLKGERNGEGKEYYKSGKLGYEGEDLNGKRNGKGKEYNENGELIFEGEYLNGKSWNGKLYYYRNDGLRFTQEYLNGKKI